MSGEDEGAAPQPALWADWGNNADRGHDVLPLEQPGIVSSLISEQDAVEAWLGPSSVTTPSRDDRGRYASASPLLRDWHSDLLERTALVVNDISAR